MTDRILIVGAGFGQLPAIDAALRLGVEVVVIDRNPEAPGMTRATHAEAVDLVDIEGAVAVARRWGVGGALTLQSDIGVPTVGAIVDALGLPGNGRAVADRCSHKVLLRERLAEAGVPQPAFAVVESGDEAVVAARAIGFPCVVKAPDSSGSRGVVRCDGEGEVEAAFAEARRWARTPRILVEAFVDGVELGAQTFSLDGSCRVVALHNDTLSSPPWMIPVGHSFPISLAPSARRGVEDAVRRCVDALGISTGPANVDLIVGKDGTPYIIEVGARLGATCLPELVTYHTGVDWVEASVQAALGRPVDVASCADRACAALIVESPSDGVFEGADGVEAVRGHPDVLEVEVTARPGDQVQRLRKGTDRIGKVVVRGSSPDQAEATARAMRDRIGIRVRSA